MFHLLCTLDYIEAKSMTINRMQNNLQDWDKKLKIILEKKSKNGNESMFWDLMIFLYIVQTQYAVQNSLLGITSWRS
jgi:hypothetical protein